MGSLKCPQPIKENHGSFQKGTKALLPANSQIKDDDLEKAFIVNRNNTLVEEGRKGGARRGASLHPQVLLTATLKRGATG